MWTYNSASNLLKSLPSIDKAIPGEAVCHKIAVDGGSTDRTQTYLRDHGWTILKASRKGIPFQANYALSQVDTEYFAAFEHDIILNAHWFQKTSETIAKDRTIGAVQGVRLLTGSKTMQAIDEWKVRMNRVLVWEYSIDNTLFRTEAVKGAGGFPSEDPASADTILRTNMFRLGYKWITDPTLISGHYRKDFLEQFRHQLKIMELTKYYWWSSPPGSNLLKRIISALGGNPLYVFEMTVQSRMLRIPPAWYALRLQRAFFLKLPQGKKTVKQIAMDQWYLDLFENAVLASSRRVKQVAQCAYCGTSTTQVFMVPNNWGNILPRLQHGIGREFFACSDEHARRVAEKIFKNAFDFIEPGQRV